MGSAWWWLRAAGAGACACTRRCCNGLLFVSGPAVVTAQKQQCAPADLAPLPQLAAEAERALRGNSAGRASSLQRRQQQCLHHMVSKHTDGGAMRNYWREAASVARFLARMAQHAERFSLPLNELAKQLNP